MSSAHLMWFRRDLRLNDNAALYQALKDASNANRTVHCVFVFDTTILAGLPKQDRRLAFIWDSLQALQHSLRKYGANLRVIHADPVQAIPMLMQELNASTLYANHDDEPYALQRDSRVLSQLNASGCQFKTFKDHVVFERGEVLTAQATPYSVFTPYKTAWLKKLNPFYLKPYPVLTYIHALSDSQVPDWSTPEQIGFDVQHRMALNPGEDGANQQLNVFLDRIGQYEALRDYPAKKGPSYLSVHLRFGTISIRQCVAAALQVQIADPQAAQGATVWMSELIWRDFYHQIMYHNPHAMQSAYKPIYDRIQWAPADIAKIRLQAWCNGKTGYPLVDAAQRQLLQTGYMHNRLRMVSASFLVKDLGIDWRAGEAFFAQHLNDFDLAANNGGWQWAASSGCDAQPYFRIFNPITQSQKFDAQGAFIRRYVPELAGFNNVDIHAPWTTSPIVLASLGIELGKDYPAPIVDHAQARLETLERYSVVKSVS